MSDHPVLLFLSLFPLLLLLEPVSADVFTAMVELQNLLSNEAGSTSFVIEEYIQSELERLRRLQEFADHYMKARESASDVDAIDEKSVMNPINAYLLIKRLSSDWKNIKFLISGNKAETFIQNITAGREERAVKYPGDEDLEGAAIGLIRLQDTYRLKADELAKGFVGKNSVGKGLNAQDCFEIGRAAYTNKEYYYTIEWMTEAMARDPPRWLEIEIFEYLAYSLYMQGNPKRAYSLTLKLAEMHPTHPRATGNIDWYKEKLAPEELNDLENLPPVKNIRMRVNDIPERDEFERLCRGEFDIDPKVQASHYCYFKRDRPFLKLAPLKVEILRYEPMVAVFRGVISDAEVEVVKKLATPRLNRATVQNAKTGLLEFANYRISKSAWLKEHEHKVVAQINRRIDLMTNLEQSTAEDLQVANYGIGGHYDPHFDFSRRGEKDPYGTSRGNRVATVLFYMSQPENGGITAFTELGMGVFPSYGDALFWYNLLRDGEGDLRTRHAACPVLSGVKWVSNKWIHERGQEFKRPCPLKQGANERFPGDTRPNFSTDLPNIDSLFRSGLL